MKHNQILFIISILLLIIKIQCEIDCSSCTPTVPTELNSENENLLCQNCDEQCKWFQIDSSNYKCLSCDNIKEGESQYYSKGLTVDDEPYCHKIGLTGFNNKKIIYGTKQIVNSCSSLSLYEMGDFCYHSNPDENKIEASESPKKLKCKFYNYKILEDGLIKYQCLEEGKTCPPELNYFDSNTKECFNSCPENKPKISIIKETENGIDKIFFGCSSKCEGEYDKEFTKILKSGETKTYCYKDCPEEAKYFYVESDKKICINNCNKTVKDFFNHENKCTNNIGDCGENYYFAINSKKNYFSCINYAFSSCPNDYPYKYNSNGINYCLTTCDDTNIPFFDNNKKITYLYIEGKQCTDQQPISNYYIDEKEKKWVNGCLTSNSGPFHDGLKCVQKCDQSKYIVEDTFECVENCVINDENINNNYYIDEETKTCVKECPEFLGRGFYNSNKECVKCGISGEGSGFRSEKECLSSCGEGQKYNYKNNTCFTEDCKTHGYKYISNDNNNICYNSCADIGNDYIYEMEFICYKIKPTTTTINDYYFYKKTNGIYKYIKKEDAFKICYNLGLKYIKDSECIQDCSSSEYKIYPTANSLGQCFSSFDNCKEYDNGYIYYNDLKICSKECNGLIPKELDNSIANTEKGNCLEECPTEYPFKNGDTCLKKCPENYYYIENGNKKICQNSCDDFIITDPESQKKCSKQCIKEYNDKGIPVFNYYYTDTNGLKYCIDSCYENSKFSLEATNEHKECIDSCPVEAPYYYEDKKICLKQCKKYYDGNKCIDDCTSYVYMENNCMNLCPKDAPFSIEITEESKTIKKCVTSCLENGYDYFDSNKKCTNDIPEGYKIFNGGLIENCPSGMQFDDESKKCIKEESDHFFEITESGYQGLDDCTKYKTTSSQCVEKCPIGEHFIDSGVNNLNCLSSCGALFYQKYDSGSNSDSDDYTIYKCLESSDPDTSSCLHIKDKKQCLNDCGYLFKYEDGNECILNCGNDYSMFKSAAPNNKHICKAGCDDFNLNDGYSYYGTDKICEKECSFLSTKIFDEGKKICVDECDKNTDYKFLILKNGKLHCSNSCDQTSEYKRFSKEDYKCISKCPKFYDVEAEECKNECPSPKMIEKIDDEYFCKNECSSDSFYYINTQLCLSRCYPGDYIIQDTNKCTKKCSLSENGKIYYYEYDSTLENNDNNLNKDSCVSSCLSTNKPFTRENNHCDISCDSDPSGDYYYNEDNKICKKKCDNNEKTNNEKCETSCGDKFEDEKGNCIDNCNYSITGYIYNIKDDLNCINICPDTKFIDNNVCLDSCLEQTNKYGYDYQCSPTCPKGKRYFDEEEKICLEDCPPEFPYYKITEDNLFICQKTCKAYVPDSNKNTLLCLGEECFGNYQYYIEETKNGETIKQCYSKCPEGFFYSEEQDVNKKDIKCFGECNNSENLYNFINDNKCYEISNCKFLDYYTKKCVFSCPDKIYETESLTYCLNDCADYEEETLFLNYENKCVKNCKENYEKEDTQNNICECENLYILDKSRGIKSCLNKEETTCEKQVNYPYLIKDSNQCSDTCDGIISLNGLECYNENYQCPENTEKITLQNGLKQCFCKYKYYYTTSFKKDIICLEENSNCIRNDDINRELFISNTNECVEYCHFEKYTKKFGRTCVDLCPIMSVVVNDECFCQDKWYLDDKSEMICTEECPKDKPILIDETKECVNTCLNTEYPVYFRNKCYSNCDNIENTVQINEIKNIEKIVDESDPNYKYIEYNLYKKYGEYGDSICYCKGPWYEDGNNYGCNENKESSCDVFKNEFAYKYEVIPTKQCVKECPKDFNFSFNEFCFKSCEQGNSHLSDYNTNSNKKIIDGDSNICKCKNLWKYEEDDISKIVCLEEETCNDDLLLIVSTNECYNGIQCREENPLLFNKKCYNTKNCPKNSIFKEAFPNTCSCEKYYYISNDEIFCLAENEDCKEEYPYLIYSENKCVKENDEELNDLYNFNRIYYSNCPYLTKATNDNNNCICDILYGYWYKDSDNNLYCGRRECPQEKSNYIADTRECIVNCSSDNYNYVEYNGICYDECPELTEENEDKKCEIKKTIDSNNSTELTEVIKDNIVSLYKASKKEENENENEEEKEKDDSNIIELVNCNLTVEFYGVNNNKKENKKNHNNKNKASASLSYIDLSECMQQIYENNNMRPDDDIIILKYDITNTPKEYLINPVEYKLINSRNGQELDASACGKASIKISYPFNNIMNNYDKISKKRNLKTIMIDIKNDNGLITLSDKYNIGKEINAEYSYIDTFNSKDNIYTDYCSAVEINGKDLVLEDRMNYLLPHYSLCERNCTYNHTDFEEERIYCDCPFKNEFDVEREHQAEIDLNENAVIQSQGGETNFPVLKCISVLGDSKRIRKNIAFYYMLIIIIIEICLLIMTILFGINSFKLFFGKTINDNEINNENDIELKINEKDKDKKYGEEIIRTTERNLNAPPIKNNKTENEEENKEENKNEEKNNNNNNNEENEIEFIPDEFLFLYFNEKDKGIRKKVEKELLPFSINKKTKILLQKMENVDYTNVKAAGPFQEDQNLIEVVGNEEEKVNINIESINESIIENDKIKITEKNKINNKLNEKDIIPIKEETIYKRKNLKNYIINDLDEVVEEKEKEIENKKAKSLLDEIKIEQRLLTKDYEFASNKNECDLFTLILTEILDKIYIVKNILFIRKYEIMYLYLSVYALYHLILLTFLAMFYNIKTIKKIWNKENYPGMGLYFGYAFLSLIISWIIYILFICLLSNKGKYNEIMSIKNSKKKKKGNKMQLLKKKVNSLLSKMKTKIIIYYIVQFIIIILFFIYLVTLCAVYSGTMNKIFASYGVAILEIIIIKIIYGLILAILRYSSLSSQKRGLYNCVLFLDKYIV